MAKDNHFVKDFYCKECGSTTALCLPNLSMVRCMGCDIYYRYDRYSSWVEVDRKEDSDMPPAPEPDSEF